MLGFLSFSPLQGRGTQFQQRPGSPGTAGGLAYLQELLEIFKPARIAEIGRKGASAINTSAVDGAAVYIRHPSHRGQKDFIGGMELLIPE